ncbi:MAG: hypothetical protein WA908_10510 [Pontixanthobacter sp.]
MLGGLGLGGALIGALALIVWIVVLVWLAERVLRFTGLRTGWPPLDWRNIAVSIIVLGGAIHFGNYAIDIVEAFVRDQSSPSVPIPSAFLIGSVAIGTGIAAIRWHRKQKPK